MTAPKYRDLAWDRLLEIIHQAAGGPPREEAIEAALTQFRSKFNAAIDGVPAIAELLDRSEQAAQEDDDTQDPINRADEIAAQITQKLQHR